MSKANKQTQNGEVDFTTWERDQWKEVRTYDGYYAEIVDNDMGGDKPLLVKFENEDGRKCHGRMTSDGRLHKETPFLVPLNGRSEDINVLEQGFGYCNFRERENGAIEGGVVYPTRVEAERRATENTVVSGVRVSLS